MHIALDISKIIFSGLLIGCGKKMGNYAAHIGHYAENYAIFNKSINLVN